MRLLCAFCALFSCACFVHPFVRGEQIVLENTVAFDLTLIRFFDELDWRLPLVQALPLASEVYMPFAQALLTRGFRDRASFPYPPGLP